VSIAIRGNRVGMRPCCCAAPRWPLRDIIGRFAALRDDVRCGSISTGQGPIALAGPDWRHPGQELAPRQVQPELLALPVAIGQ
jgi:hypothetical protein